MKNKKSLNQSLLDHTRWIPALCVGHVWPHATNSRALLGVTCPGVIRRLHYFVQRTYIEPYMIDSKERTTVNMRIDKIIFHEPDLVSFHAFLFRSSRDRFSDSFPSFWCASGVCTQSILQKLENRFAKQNVTIINKDSASNLTGNSHKHSLNNKGLKIIVFVLLKNLTRCSSEVHADVCWAASPDWLAWTWEGKKSWTWVSL